MRTNYEDFVGTKYKGFERTKYEGFKRTKYEDFERTKYEGFAHTLGVWSVWNIVQSEMFDHSHCFVNSKEKKKRLDNLIALSPLWSLCNCLAARKMLAITKDLLI